MFPHVSPWCWTWSAPKVGVFNLLWSCFLHHNIKKTLIFFQNSDFYPVKTKLLQTMSMFFMCFAMQPRVLTMVHGENYAITSKLQLHLTRILHTVDAG